MKNNENGFEEILEILKSTSFRKRFIEPKYYRNIDLKRIFSLSSNTIIKYREEGILPYTLLGEIYLYPVIEINQILEKNSSSINLK